VVVPMPSAAGEAEEVPRVVHPLVDHHGLAEYDSMPSSTPTK
jgi:hypothetical protein